MDDKKRKGAIVVASILGLVAVLYLAGLLAQVLNNYSIGWTAAGLPDKPKCRQLSSARRSVSRRHLPGMASRDCSV